MPNKISKHKKNVYIRRAKRQARRQFAPQRQLIRKQQRRLRRQRASDLASVGGAIEQFSDVVSDAQAGLADSGLKGRYLKQTSAELANRAADAAQAAPDLRAQIRSEYQPEFASIRDALASSRIEQSQTAESTFRTMLEERQAAIAKRQEERQADQKGNRRAVRIGLQSVGLNHEQNMNLLNTPDKELSESALADKQMLEEAMKDPDYYWRVVAQDSSGEGLDPLQATRATNLYRRQIDEGLQGGLARGVGTAAIAGAGQIAGLTGIGNANPTLFELYRRLQGG